MRFSKSVVFCTPFLRSSTLQIYAVLRLFRLSFLYILFLTFIKGFLIKVNTFRVSCGTKSIDYIKNDRALCAPSPIFLQSTIQFRPVVFYFSMPISAFFSLFLSQKAIFSFAFRCRKAILFSLVFNAKTQAFYTFSVRQKGRLSVHE